MITVVPGVCTAPYYQTPRNIVTDSDTPLVLHTTSIHTIQSQDIANTVEVEDGEDFDGSDHGSGVESSTWSLTSSLKEYVEQNGRRYHVYFGPNKNPMPNDNLEQDRLDLVHECLFLLSNERLYRAPLGKYGHQIHNVLDLGTGTGVWALDFAYAHPESQVLGIDLSPIQPDWVAPNCKFEVDDFELEWTFKKPFDFIHARSIGQAVNDWDKLFTQMKRHLTPGGWVEISEWDLTHHSDDNTLPDDWPPALVFSHVREALQRIGRPNITKPYLRSLLENAGFVNINVHTYKLPCGPWAKNPALKQAGAMYASGSETGYEAYLLQLGTQVLGMPEEEVVDLCKRAYECHLDMKQKVHAYVEFHIAYGQKADE